MVDDIECYGLIKSKENMDRWTYAETMQYMRRTATNEPPALLDTVGKIRLADIEYGDYVDIFGVVLIEPPEIDPTTWVMISEGLMVRKDFMSLGFIRSTEGIIILDGGQSALPNGFDNNPVIYLAQADSEGKDRLEIRKGFIGDEGWGGLEIGELETHYKIEINPKIENPVINFRKNDSDPVVMLGHDGTDAYLHSADGDLILIASESGKKVKVGTELLPANLQVTNQVFLNLNSRLWDQSGQRMIIQAYNNRLDVLNLTGNAYIVSFDRNAGGSGLAGIKFGDNLDVAIYRRAANTAAIQGHFNPSQGNTYGCGTGTFYWSGVVCETIYRHSESSFDALDDIALLKQYRTKKIIDKNGLEREVIDIETLPFLKADPTPEDPNLSDFWDESRVSGFLLGCVKQLALKVEQLEKQLKEGCLVEREKS